MTGSLRLRLLVALAAILVCGTLIQALVAYRGARAAADAQFDYQMEQIALSIAYGMPESPDPRSPRLAADIAAIFRRWQKLSACFPGRPSCQRVRRSSAAQAGPPELESMLAFVA